LFKGSGINTGLTVKGQAGSLSSSE